MSYTLTDDYLQVQELIRCVAREIAQTRSTGKWNISVFQFANVGRHRPVNRAVAAVVGCPPVVLIQMAV